MYKLYRSKTKTEEIMQNELNIKTIKHLRGIRVLVAEDNEINQNVLLEMLKIAGIVVTIANNGVEAISYVKNNEYDIVLMDIRMPLMDGCEATAEIRKDKKFEKLPIVAVTAGAMQEDCEKCLQGDFNDYITKPIGITQLFQTITHWINVEQKSETVSALITKIDAIDLKEAERHLGANHKLLYKLLTKFHKNQKNVINEIRQAIDDDDVQTAIRLAHTVKGVAGEIAAFEVYRIAAELEIDLLRENFNNIETLLVQLEQELEKAFSYIASLERSLEKTLSPSPNPSMSQSPSPNLSMSQGLSPLDKTSNLNLLNVSMLKPLFNNLKKLLLDNDLDAVECIEEIEKLAGQTSVKEKVTEMKTYADQYHFEEALLVLEEALLVL